jgi:hypothetical protein
MMQSCTRPSSPKPRSGSDMEQWMADGLHWGVRGKLLVLPAELVTELVRLSKLLLMARITAAPLVTWAHFGFGPVEWGVVDFHLD